MSGQILRETLSVINQRGLHARAAAKFVKCLEPFDISVEVHREGSTVGGDSIMGLLMLGAHKGSTIDVTMSGPQANEAMEALSRLIADKFGEAE
jgi:phosphocarrier protein